jgi:hypothetical protein
MSSLTLLFDCRTYGSENLRPMLQKDFCNTIRHYRKSANLIKQTKLLGKPWEPFLEWMIIDHGDPRSPHEATCPSIAFRTCETLLHVKKYQVSQTPKSKNLALLWRAGRNSFVRQKQE